MSPSGELRDRVYGDLRFQRRISRGVVSWEGSSILGGACHLSTMPTWTMCTVVPEAVFTRATFQAAFRSTRFSADCQRNLQACGIVHIRKHLRGPTLICSHTKKSSHLHFLTLCRPKSYSCQHGLKVRES